MDTISVDLSGLSAEEILKINTVLERNQKVRRQESQRCRQLKFATFANKDDFKKITRSTGEWFNTLKKPRETDNSIGGSKSSLWSGGLSSIPNSNYQFNKTGPVQVAESRPIPTPRASPRTNPPSENNSSSSIIGRIRGLEVKRKNYFRTQERTDLSRERPRSEPYKLNGFIKLNSSGSTRPSSKNVEANSSDVAGQTRRRSVQLHSDDSGMPQDAPLETGSDKALPQIHSDLGEIITELDDRLSQGHPKPPPRPSLSHQAQEKHKPVLSEKIGKHSKASKSSADISAITESHENKRKTPQLKENDTQEGSLSQFGTEQKQGTETAESNQSCISSENQQDMEIYKNGTLAHSESILSFGSAKSEGEESLGQIAFSLKFDFEDGNKLIFSVVDCVDIPSIPLANHPYIKVYLMPDKVKKKTKVASNRHRHRSPVFNAMLNFQVDVMKISSKSLQIQLWDLNPLGRNRLLSGLNVELEQLEAFAQVNYHNLLRPDLILPKSSALTLSYRGTIRFALRYNPKERTLEAVAVSGENLAVSATWPYVKVHIFPGIRGKQKGPAQNKPSPLNPEFNHLFTFNSMRKSIMAESGIHISCFNSESIRGDRLIGNCRIGPHCCLPLEELPTGPRPENLIWTQIQEAPNKWHYINLEMNLNKYSDIIPNG